MLGVRVHTFMIISVVNTYVDACKQTFGVKLRVIII